MSSGLSLSLSTSASPSLSHPSLLSSAEADFSPPPSPTAVNTSASTVRDRLQLLLSTTSFLGPTTARQRAHLDKSSLIQRNLEIQAQLLLIDEQLEELPSESEGAEVRGQLARLYEESDALAEESDEVETLLYEKWRLKSGGRMWLVDEMREAAVVGERLARGTKGRLGGEKVVSVRVEESESKESVEEVEEAKEEEKEERKEGDMDESKERDVDDPQPVNDSNDAAMQGTDATADSTAPTLSTTPVSRRGRRRRGRLTAPVSKRKRQSKSDAAMLARLNAQADENERRRQERAEVNKGSLLGKLYQYFDTEIDVDRVAPRREQETDEQREERRKRMTDRRKAAARSYPYILGTITFPLFPLSDDRKDAMADDSQLSLSGEAESVRLDFGTEVPIMGEDGCVVRRHRKGVAMEEDDIVGFLPFPFHFTPFQTATTTPFTLPTSPFPLPLHPLLALHLLLQAHLVSIECSIDRHSRHYAAEEGGGSSSTGAGRDEVDVVIFIHDKFLQRTRLRSHLLRQAMLSLFRSFPAPAAEEEEEEEGEEGMGIEERRDGGEREEKEDEVSGAELDKAEGGDIVIDHAATQQHQPATDIFTLLQQRRADSSLSFQPTKPTTSSPSSLSTSPALVLSPVSIATTASLSSSSSLLSPTVTSVPVGGGREKRRIVPVLVQEDTGKEGAAVGWGKEEKEQKEESMEEDQEELEEDDDQEEEEEDEGEEELEDEEDEYVDEEEEEDEFGLDELDPVEHMHCFVPLHLMSAPPPSDQPQQADSAIPLTEEEMKEEKQMEEEGVRIEESYELDPAVLADEGSASTIVSAASSTVSSPTSTSSTQPSPTNDPTRTSLHTLAWQKRDLDSLYDSIRPSPSYARHPNPLTLATSLLPFQQQALAWMVERETRPRTLPHPLYESVVVHGLRCWYNRVSGEMESVQVVEVKDVRGGILAEMMGLGKTIEMIALVLERPYKPPVSIASLLPLMDVADERKAEETTLKVEEAKTNQEASTEASVAPPLPRLPATAEYFNPPRSPPFGPAYTNTTPLRSPPPARLFRTPSFTSPLSPTLTSTSHNKLRAPPSPTLINATSGKPEVKGTLIITPMSIVYQWQAEINKHAPSLRVLIYKSDMKINLFPTLAQSAASAAMGMSPEVTAPPSASVSSPMSPASAASLSASPATSLPGASSATLALSEYDIVLCNYSILASQVNYSQQPHYNLRYAKQYAVPLSPLLEVHWHRLVLDEAQRVQSPTANSARMCQRVNASYRWAVTGTPIGLNGLNDMYGLISFLGVGEYSSAAVWQHVMRVEEEEGMARLRELLRRVMWRHSKAQVKDQIALPPLYTHTHYLRFNEVEHEAYRRMEFEIRGRLAFQVVHGMLGERDDYVKRIDALRQMCDHPQVLAGGLFNATGRGGGRGGAGDGRRFDTMEVIGWRIMQRAKDEASEREREVCRTLNWTGFLLRKYGREEEAEVYLKESWRIYDRGLEEAAEDDREKRRFEGEEKMRTEEMRARKGEEEDGGEFDSESNIVTVNTQAKQWRYIELVASYHLKEIYQRRLDATPDDVPLQANIHQLQDKIDKALDELLDLLEMQLKEAREYIEDMIHRILPLWTTRLEAEPQAVYSEWKAAASMEAFFNSPHYKTVLQLQKKYQRLERHVERICNLMDKERYILHLEDLVQARQSSPEACRHRQFVHQQLLNTYYAADVQAAVDRVLGRALATQQRERKNVWQQLGKSAQTADEIEELRTLDWSDDVKKAEYEARWSLMREQMNAMLALVDLRKAVKKEWKLKELMGKTRRYLLRQCANPPANFGQQGIAIYEVEEGEEEKKREGEDGEDGADEEKEGKVRKERKGGKEEKEEKEEKKEEKVDETLLTADELEQVLLTLKTRLADYKVEAQQKQRHVKYLKNKLSMLSGSSTISSSSSTSTATAATSSSSSSSSSAPAVVGEACPICNGALVQPVITSCGHVYCLSCLQRWMKKRIGRRDGSDGRETRLGGWERGSCPTCRHELVRDDVVEMPQDEVKAIAMEEDELHEVEEKDDDDPFTVTTTSSYTAQSNTVDDVRMPSLAQLASLHFEGEGESGTKVDCIIRHLLYLTRHHPRTKSLVYSQFPRMLLLFSHALTRAGIAHLQLTGNDSKAAAILHTFSTSSSHPILLLSLRRDSSGLTLVSASHVFLFEPSLSRSVELQAVNRVHRIGQRSVCHVYRFVMRRSVEAKIDQQVHGGGGDGGEEEEEAGEWGGWRGGGGRGGWGGRWVGGGGEGGESGATTEWWCENGW